METDNVPSQCDPELRSQRLEFLTKRLDHTLDHVHKTTQLIYLADGAVLALVGYWLTASRFDPKSVGMAIVPMIVLLAMNWLHAGFIANQHYWYKIFDKKISDLLFPDVQNVTESAKSNLSITKGNHLLFILLTLSN